jgi:hypothetical protein
LIPTLESALTVNGNGVDVIVAFDGLKLGDISHVVLSAHDPIAAPEWFTIVSCALPNVSVKLAYVSAGIFVRLRNARSVCRWLISTSVGVESTETGALLESDGCKLAPVIIASKNTMPTPFGGVSPTDKVIGTAFPAAGGVFELPPQPAINP